MGTETKKKIGLVIASAVLLLATIVGMKMSLSQTTTLVSVNPAKTFVGSTGKNFTITVDIENANETYAWQFNMTWNPTVLNITGVTEGPFLSKNGANLTSLALGQVITINYTEGWALIGNTLLIEDPIVYPTGDGTLAMLNYTVLAEGTSHLNLTDTILIYKDVNTEYDHETSNGSFVLLWGDINGDGFVNVRDIFRLGKAYNLTSVPDKECDLDNDGNVDQDDLAILSNNYGNG